VQDRLFLEQLLLDASQTTTIQYIPASSPARFFFPRIIAKLRRFLGGLRRP
jgi:hypothetical protein